MGVWPPGVWENCGCTRSCCASRDKCLILRLINESLNKVQPTYQWYINGSQVKVNEVDFCHLLGPEMWRSCSGGWTGHLKDAQGVPIDVLLIAGRLRIFCNRVTVCVYPVLSVSVFTAKQHADIYTSVRCKPNCFGSNPEVLVPVECGPAQWAGDMSD